MILAGAGARVASSVVATAAGVAVAAGLLAPPASASSGEQSLSSPPISVGAEYQGALPAEFYVVDERPPEVVFREGIAPPRMVTGAALPHDLVRHAWAPDQEVAGFVRAAGSPTGALRLLRGRTVPVWVYRVAPGPDLHQLRQSMRAVADAAWARSAAAFCTDAAAHLDWTRYAESAEEWLRRAEHIGGRRDEWVGTDLISPERIQGAMPVRWEAGRRAITGEPLINVPAPGRPGRDLGLLNTPATRRLFAGLPPAYEARLTVEFVAQSGGGNGDIEAQPGPHLP